MDRESMDGNGFPNKRLRGEERCVFKLISFKGWKKDVRREILFANCIIPAFRGSYTVNSNFWERNDEKVAPNNILLISIKDTKYPINVEVVYKVCSIIGPVVKIVIFKRMQIVQAMVEFDTLENASKARKSLHGADIYSNCCTMKAEYSKLETLNVRENSVMSWDFSSALPARSERRTILNEPEVGAGVGISPSFMAASGMGSGDGRGMLGSGGMGGMGDFGGGGAMGRMMGGGSMGGMMGGSGMGGVGRERGFGSQGNEGGWGGDGGGWVGEQSCVLIVNNLPDEFNCDRLFNLVCLYGNVSKIFFMKKKKGSAMVEMCDPEAVQRVVTNLNKAEIWSRKLLIDVSR